MLAYEDEAFEERLVDAPQKQMFYTVKEAASLLKVSTDTVRRAIRAGTLRARQISPRIIRIAQHELDRFAGGDY